MSAPPPAELVSTSSVIRHEIVARARDRSRIPSKERAMRVDGTDLIRRIVRDLLAGASVTSAGYLATLSTRATETSASSFDVPFRGTPAVNAFYHVTGSVNEPGGSSRLVVSLIYPIDHGVPQIACASDRQVLASLRSGGWREEPFPGVHEQIDMRQYKSPLQEILFCADGGAIALESTPSGCITSFAVIFFKKG